jgi:tetratricopeptide (TPR) repeat protein
VGSNPTLSATHDCADVFLGYWATPRQISVVELDRGSIEETSTYGIGSVNGNKIKILFDTGAETSFISLAAAARAGVKPDDPGVVPGGIVRGIGHGHPDSWIAPFSVFRMGNEEIRHTHLRIANVDMGDADMVVGADYFLSHHIYVANSQKKIYISYNGGAVFNLTTGFSEKTATPAAAAETTVAADGVTALDAEGFARRSAASVSRRDYEAALSDLNKACALAPTEGKYLVQRSRVYYAMGKHAESLADLDHELALHSDNIDALLLRADTRRLDGKPSEGLADVQAADKAAPQGDAIRYEIGEAYLAADQFPQAVAQFDQWIPGHSDDSHLVSALNARCWARALWGRELDKAADDCNGALKRTRKGDSAYAATVDSRAMVRLRQGDCANAISDYNEALSLAPGSAWSHYGRGICELRKGDTTSGNADLVAARALSKDIDARAKVYGISP